MTIRRTQEFARRASRLAHPAGGTSTLGTTHPVMPRVHPRDGPKTFASKHVRDRGAVKLPVTGPRLARSTRGRKGSRTASAHRFGPLRHAAHASRPDPQVGHIHSSRCRTTGSPEGERRSGRRPGDAPAGEAGGEFLLMRTTSPGEAASIGPSPIPPPAGDGGARRDRTDDLVLAKHALYRLSYCPSGIGGRRSEPCGSRYPKSAVCPSTLVGLGRLELPTSRLSSARSNRLSYKPEAIPPKDDPPVRRRPIGFSRGRVIREGRETKTAASRQKGP